MTREVSVSSEPTVLFVCLHGSAKSVIAAEHFLRAAAERGIRARADAAGLEPDAEIPPHVRAGLSADGIDVAGRRPQPLSEVHATAADRIITLGCELPGLGVRPESIENWGDVPAVSDGYDAARRAIVRHVEDLLDRMPARA